LAGIIAVVGTSQAANNGGVCDQTQTSSDLALLLDQKRQPVTTVVWGSQPSSGPSPLEEKYNIRVINLSLGRAVYGNLHPRIHFAKLLKQPGRVAS